MKKYEPPEEIRGLFYSFYNNDKNNLKFVGKELLKNGFGHMDILIFTKNELKLTLGEALNLLDFPDYIG